jgi:glycosyltransferase involved in cell wall biosynthesis
VHYHALGPSLLAFVPRLLGIRTVVTVQGLDWQRAKWGRVARWVLRLGEAAAVRFPDRTIVVSKDLRRYYEAHHGCTPTYVPNGVTVPGKSPPTSPLEAWGLTPGQYILYVGRLSPEKRCDLLIEAYERIRPAVRLVFAGASSYTDGYVRELQRHASDDVRFLGQVTGEPLAALVSQAAVFVLPSAIEGLSIALLEAMAQGTCVLTSDIAENVEALGGAGYTFASGDAADLGRVLRRLLADAPGREAMGRRAVERVRKAYRWSHVTAETERVYRDALASSHEAADRMRANAP